MRQLPSHLPKLSPDLFRAFEWTAAAGELTELRALDGHSPALGIYVNHSAANYCDQVHESDGGVAFCAELVELAEWLRSLDDTEFARVLRTSR